MSSLLNKSFKSNRIALRTNQKRKLKTINIWSLLAYISIPLLPILLSISTSSDVAFAADNSEVKGATISIEAAQNVRLIDNPLYNNVYAEDVLFPPNVISVVTKDNYDVSFTEKGTVKEILEELGFEYSELDTITPDLDEFVSTGAIITIVEVEHEIEEVNEVVEYETQIIEDETMDIGTEVVMQEGENGVYTELYKTVFEDGEEVEKTFVGDRMTKTTTPRILKVGKKPLVNDVKPDNAYSCAKWDTAIDEIATTEEENTWMKYVMRCESACNAAQDSTTGTYKGLFQFLPYIFDHYSEPGESIWDGYAQLKIVHMKFHAGDRDAWGSCNAGFYATHSY